MNLRLLFSTLLCLCFFGATSQITTVGLIGNATPGGWATDTDMVQDGADTALWTLNITLLDSLVKFRANNDWPINWGSSDFPSGIGTQDGDDIPVFAGDYHVTLNTVTGEYNFEVVTPITILGDATPGGWDTDSPMYKDTSEHGYFTILDLTEASAKFRKDLDWDAGNWGSADFPSGIGTFNGDNIPVSPAGKYRITLDTMSGAYNFEEVIEFEFISLTGPGVDGGDWGVDTDLAQDSGDADLWKGNITLVDGPIKFRANHDWIISWGGSDFPTGTAGEGDIPATAGDYQVTFNTATLEYSFLIIEPYEFISIIGDGSPSGNWEDDTDMVQDADNPEIWELRAILTDGEVVFRADHSWITASWGAADFPTGTGGLNSGINIPVTAGEYKITFNTITGDYNFELIVVYTAVGLVGSGSPSGEWNSDDTFLNQNADDEHLWELLSVTLTDGEIKFRADSAWTVNWGSADFPSGVGVQGGDNILCIAGTYSVSINTNFGDYLFADPVATREEILSPSSVSVYPNPTSDRLNIDVSNINMKGEVRMTVVDMQGRVMSTKIVDASNINSLDVSNLANGNYLLQITNSKFIIGKRFNVVK